MAKDSPKLVTRLEILTTVRNQMLEQLIRNQIDYQYNAQIIDMVKAEKITAAIDPQKSKNLDMELHQLNEKSKAKAAAIEQIPITLQVVDSMIKAEKKEEGSSAPEVEDKHKSFSRNKSQVIRAN